MQVSVLLSTAHNKLPSPFPRPLSLSVSPCLFTLRLVSSKPWVLCRAAYGHVSVTSTRLAPHLGPATAYVSASVSSVECTSRRQHFLMRNHWQVITGGVMSPALTTSVTQLNLVKAGVGSRGWYLASFGPVWPRLWSDHELCVLSLCQ